LRALGVPELLARSGIVAGRWWLTRICAIYSRLMQSLLSPHGVYTA